MGSHDAVIFKVVHGHICQDLQSQVRVRLEIAGGCRLSDLGIFPPYIVVNSVHAFFFMASFLHVSLSIVFMLSFS